MGSLIDLSKLPNHFPAGFPFSLYPADVASASENVHRTNRICRIFLQIHTFYICPIERTKGAAAIRLQPNKKHDVKTHILRKKNVMYENSNHRRKQTPHMLVSYAYLADFLVPDVDD